MYVATKHTHQIKDRMLRKPIQILNDLRIGTRLTIGVMIILFLTLVVGLVGWFTLESQAHSQVLANQAIDLVSALRAARQDEKNYMLSGDARHIKETLDAIENIRENAQILKSALSEEKRKKLTQLLVERDNYQNEFEDFVELNRKKELSLQEMVSQGRELENAALILRNDQKNELQRLETLAVTSSNQRQEKSKKADDANRMIKLMGEARQKEKNFLLRNDSHYAEETANLVDKLISQTRTTKSHFSDTENKALAEQIIRTAKQYRNELNKVVDGKKKSNVALKSMIHLGRLVEDYSMKLREDQKQELLNLEQQSNKISAQRLDKREKADSANRIIKLMGEARQQEKNFLLRKEQSYVEITRSLVSKMIEEANNLRGKFNDRQNRALAAQIIQAAEQYLKEFNKVVSITYINTSAQDVMASLGRKVGELASKLRSDQKQELQRLELLSTRSSKQRLDKRVKADAANRIIKLMGEARQQEKNFLLRRELTYADATRSLVGKSVHQAQRLRRRFQDIQNRQLAGRIILAAETYLGEFDDVVVAQTEQVQQQGRMVNAARKIESLAGDIRNQTQTQANISRETAVTIILVTLSLALILGVVAAVMLTNSISTPIQNLVEVINRLAKEDDVDVPLVLKQDEIGQIARAISNFKEVILKRKEKTEAQLIQAEKMAALGDLMAGVAHEINTPIGIAVTGSSHLQDQIGELEKNFDRGVLKKSEFKEFVDNAMPTAAIVQKNLERASSLIKSFKQVAVDQSSQGVRQFKLLEYIEEVLISLQPKLKQTQHKVIVKGDKHLSVETVPGALAQIITNLIINSLTHAYEEDGDVGEIQIQVENIGNNVIIKYSDDGKGMDEKIRARMYEPFFTTRRASGGSGLGLSIVFNLVSQTLGGSIQCYTEMGKGTKFEISFPVKFENKQVLSHE